MIVKRVNQFLRKIFQCLSLNLLGYNRWKRAVERAEKSVICESAISKPFLTSALFRDANTTGFMLHVWTKKKFFPPDNGK